MSGLHLRKHRLSASSPGPRVTPRPDRGPNSRSRLGNLLPRPDTRPGLPKAIGCLLAPSDGGSAAQICLFMWVPSTDYVWAR